MPPWLAELDEGHTCWRIWGAVLAAGRRMTGQEIADATDRELNSIKRDLARFTNGKGAVWSTGKGKGSGGYGFPGWP